MFMLVTLAFFLGYGVISRTAEGVTAEYPPYRQCKPNEKATFLKCLEGIGRTGRCKPATSRFDR